MGGGGVEECEAREEEQVLQVEDAPLPDEEGYPAEIQRDTSAPPHTDQGA